MWRRITSRIRGARRSPLLASIVLAALANPGCDDACHGHDAYTNERWCDQDRVLACYWESSGNRAEVKDQCQPGGCYEDPKTHDVGCRVPDYTCPEGVTGYQCLGERRIECENGVAWDHDDCSQYITPDAPAHHCVENPGGEILACGYTNERCTTPGEVRCLGQGTVICRDSVWQGFVPSSAVGQKVCDASSIRYDMGWCSTRASTWCEADAVWLCDNCVDYEVAREPAEDLCVGFTKLAQCEPGTCVRHPNDRFPNLVTGCQESAVECLYADQPVCIGDRPGYCVAAGVVALDRPCSELWDLTPICKATVDPSDPGNPITNRVTCDQ